MKTRNTTVLSLKDNKKAKNMSKIKKSKIIKGNDTLKDASYRDSHNIGRRKSTSSVVTYSLDSRLFFDVYAKFNKEDLSKERNVYNGLYKSRKKSEIEVVSQNHQMQSVNNANYCEINCLTEFESPNKQSKNAKLLYEAKPIRSDEACIPSPKIPAISPIKQKVNKPSTFHSIFENHNISTKNLSSSTTNIVKIDKNEDIKTITKNETFQKLLDNKTVFKKHLSQNLFDKQKFECKKSKISDSRRLSKRLNKSLEVNNSESNKLQNDNHVSTPIKEKLQKMSSEDINVENSRPKRGKRIASLNAAAIINCVQNLFDDSSNNNKRLPSRRRRLSKLSIGASKNEDEKHDKNLENGDTDIKQNVPSPKVFIEEAKELIENKKEQMANDKVKQLTNVVKECSTMPKERLLNGKEDTPSTVLKINEEKSISKNKIDEIKHEISSAINNINTITKVIKKNISPKFFDITAIEARKNWDKSLSGQKRPHALVIKNTLNRKEVSKNSLTNQGIVQENTNFKINNIISKPLTKKGAKKKLPPKICNQETNQEIDNNESLWEWEGEPFQKMLQLQLAGPVVERTCYNSIRHSRDDIVIRAMDCVMLRSNTEDQEPFLAKVMVFYLDNETGKKMMTMLWYYRPEHTEQGRLAWHSDSDVYASRHLDNNSVDCIEDKAFVLPIELYSRFMAYQKRQSAGTRPGLAARLIPINNEDCVISDSDENKLSALNGDISAALFISDFYYTINFQNSFPAEMTISNVFVCLGLYDITQHKITRNVLQAIQSPKLESLEPCKSVDSAMSISSCEAESKDEEEENASPAVPETPLSKIPFPLPLTVETNYNNFLPPISFIQNLNQSPSETTNIVPGTKSCPPPPPSKPIQPPLPSNSNTNAACPIQPNGHP